ncbi:4-hydroxybenzoate polyprenyl transferase [Thiobacillus denitrificans ATCC 25259]|uniref:4-hydroxybenzoate octaprenyltransferase n=1 Tax=Thiobacillus denitrificans (strain ATCC 25259 / T1) TaxID=292415 RepID=UBIA_THIDA|nr:4-hydroxybenzoate octaprenyltransferase [Thiobacillus denitrificans]Q3SLJ4.1 RecName: Full=4-hydroxybenzoate octaprenyltransferase; AltName: Full=4-HB polyprenyltransferase [Thiobacillus denitrificans ATCC 25259]AAZ96416.1 4-hydroxybenzoate polyprenyl transferase [Thiobacillus denitrificans ATCC 25259]
MTLTERLSLYEKLARLDKPIGILLLLWPTLWAQWLASNGDPDWLILWIFVMGVVLMRSAGCVVNDYADRDFDPHVARTRDRPIAAGKVSPKEALLLAAGLSLLAFLLILPLNALVLKLSLIALFLAGSYPFTKRFFAIPQAYLGVAFGFGIPMSYAALWGEVPAEAWLLLAANVFWAIAYDTEYAMVDRADDLKIGIKTSAITFGRFDLTAIAFCYAATLALLAWVGALRDFSGWYYAGLAAAGAIAVYHLRLIRERDPRQCFRAFLHNTWFGAAVFGGIVLHFLLRSGSLFP